jgi:hypothetical protein
MAVVKTEKEHEESQPRNAVDVLTSCAICGHTFMNYDNRRICYKCWSEETESVLGKVKSFQIRRHHVILFVIFLSIGIGILALGPDAIRATSDLFR